MAVPWIQVYSNLTSHPKIYNLAEALKLPRSKVAANAAAAGMMVGLWSWAAVKAPDGDLTGCPSRALADAAGWRGKPEVLFDALVSCKWVDEIDGQYFLHDWEEYAALFIEQVDAQKEKTRERVRTYRERKKTVSAKKSVEQDGENGNVTVTPDVTPCNAECNVTVTPDVTPCNADGNVTVTPCNAPTIPNLTIPNHTLYTSTPYPLHESETSQQEEAVYNGPIMNPRI